MMSDGSENGCQGYLQLSVTVIGPGDVPPVHDIDKEIAAEDSKPLDIAASCLMPANMQQKLEW